MNNDPAFPEKKDIHETATAWWVKRDAGPLPREDHAAFEAWLAQDPANRAAFDEVSLLCGELRALRQGRAPVASAPVRRRPWLASAFALLAASLALAFLFNDMPILWRANFHTGTGETRFVTLEDGSQVQLGAKSAIALHYSAAQRRLTLLEGEAWFQAAPNIARPFIVEAAGGTVTALGTAFDIALENAHVDVAVAEHPVAVSSGGQTVLVAEGQQSSFDAGTPASSPVQADIDSVTAWRRGNLIFIDKPLGEVVTTLGRYHHGYVFIPDPTLRQLRVTGRFHAADPLGAITTLEASLGLHAIHLTNYLVFLRE
ncbi:MAG: FecR family protein [Methylocella sp.]